MAKPIAELETPRLRMRQWLPRDFEPFATLSADPAVMAHFPDVFTREESDAFARRMQGKMDSNGWGFWVLERKRDGRFLGFTGLNHPAAELPFSPCVEIGWRLIREAWGQGYAREAATRALDFAFDELGCEKVYAFTALPNQPSLAVMRGLGMSDTGKRFMHPALPAGHRLQEHELFVMTRVQWLETGRRPWQDGSAMPRAASTDTARHYAWGEVCDGWHLLAQNDLSVIQERVPAGAGELRHFHSRARQFFYVLRGRAVIEIAQSRVELGPGQGLHVPPGVEHRFVNETDEAVEFLVISSPSSSGDRENIALA